MDEARGRADWAHTSAVLTMLANIHRDQKKKPSPYDPAHFNPYEDPKVAKDKVLPGTIQDLKAIFIDRRPLDNR